MIPHNPTETFAPQREPKIIGVIFALPAVLLTLCIGAGQVFGQTTTSDQYFNAGLTYFNVKNYSAAIGEWEKLLAADPNYTKREEVWFYIASAAIAQQTSAGDDKAVAYFIKIINQTDAQGQPVRSAYYEQALYQVGRMFFLRADQLLKAGDSTQAKSYAQDAKEQLDRFLTDCPNSPSVPQALYYQTQIAVKFLQSATETRKYAELATEKISKDTQTNQNMWADCRFYYAWALGQLGEETKARNIFGEFIRVKDPDRGPISLYELAFTYYRAGNFPTALNELNSYKSIFPNETPQNAATWLNVQRLQAMCQLQMENYPQAAALMEQLVRQQEAQQQAPSVEDYVYLVLCYFKTQQTEKANNLISLLEQYYATSVFADGIKVLRAGYYAETRQYQYAIDLINPVLGTARNVSGTLFFTKRPFNVESDAVKSGLSEEHFLRAASLLAICYAKNGDITTGRQVYDAMQQMSNEMYGRYSSIREKTLSQLNQIAQNPPTPGITSTPGTTNPPGIVVTPTAPGLGTGGSGSGSSVVTGPGTSIVRPPGSSNNSLAGKELTPEDQENWIKNCQARVDSAGDNAGYLDEVMADLDMLLVNWSMSKYNHARVAVMKGRILYKQDKVRDAYLMFEMAYELIDKDKEANNRNTETFSVAAFRLGEQAEKSANYTAAAKYYGESLATGSGQSVKYRDRLMYRMGSALLRMSDPEMRRNGLEYMLKVYLEETTSDFWSHAGLQVAIDDFNNRRYDLCEEIIDKLIEAKPDAAIIDRVLYLKGELAMQNKQWDIAYDSFDAIQVYAPSGSPFIGLAKQKQSVVRSQMQMR